MESLWGRYVNHADREFLVEIARQFHPRFWEMYLTCSLMDLGFQVVPYRGGGPDVKLDFGSKCVWIEAVAPGPGIGADKVEEIEHSVEFFRVPEEQIVLRFQSAIGEKARKARKYLEDKTISPTEPFVIAINGYDIPHARSDDEIPYAIQAVLPIGLPSITFDIKSGDPTHYGYENRRFIEKKSGSPVSTTSFYDREYSVVSGLLYSNVGAYNLLEAGRDFVFLHNPLADNPLPLGWIDRGHEYWIEDGNLRKRRGGSPGG